MTLKDEIVRELSEDCPDCRDLIDAVAVDAVVDDELFDRGYLEDVVNYGCQSGSCSGLIYHYQTRAFSRNHLEGILSWFMFRKSQGEEEPFHFLNKCETAGICFDHLAWAVYEDICAEILSFLDSNLKTEKGEQ